MRAVGWVEILVGWSHEIISVQGGVLARSVKRVRGVLGEGHGGTRWLKGWHTILVSFRVILGLLSSSRHNDARHLLALSSNRLSLCAGLHHAAS